MPVSRDIVISVLLFSISKGDFSGDSATIPSFEKCPITFREVELMALPVASISTSDREETCLMVYLRVTSCGQSPASKRILASHSVRFPFVATRPE